MFSSKKFLTLLGVAVLALGAVGCSDSDSSPTTPVDTAPPAVPTEFAATNDGNDVSLTWAPNLVDSDFQGFVVQRTHNGHVLDLVGTPSDITQFVDEHPMPGYNLYSVSAVDLNGNASAVATAGVYIQGIHSSDQLEQ